MPRLTPLLSPLPRLAPALLTLLTLAAGWQLLGCDAALTVRNAAPRVTWLAVQPPASAQDPAEITVWVSDLDGDPVDVALTVRGADGVDAALALAPGGHGVAGLATREAVGDPNGQPHVLLWDTSQAPAGPLVLTITPTDSQGDAGDAASTPAFSLDAGLPEPVALTPAR